MLTTVSAGARSRTRRFRPVDYAALAEGEARDGASNGPEPPPPPPPPPPLRGAPRRKASLKRGLGELRPAGPDKRLRVRPRGGEEADGAPRATAPRAPRLAPAPQLATGPAAVPCDLSPPGPAAPPGRGPLGHSQLTAAQQAQRAQQAHLAPGLAPGALG